MTINQDVLNFVTGKVGQTVGGGECYDLANAALRAANAATAADYGEVSANADYEWGLGVLPSSARPGDIIQFRDYRYRREDEFGWEEHTRPHHTAIVASVGNAGAIMVYEQNVGTGSNRRKVQLNQLYFQNTSEITVTGTFQIYRPQPRE